MACAAVGDCFEEGGVEKTESGKDEFVEYFVSGVHDRNLQDQRDEVAALVSFYDGGDFERMKVLSEPDSDGKGLYFLHFIIPIQEQTKPVTVDIMLPNENTGATAGDTSPILPGVSFMRSDSGQRWVSSLKISYLAPLSLQISLPPTYPSTDSPVFTLSSSWLSPVHLTALCQNLDRLWKENDNMVIIFTWIDWLENNVLSCLGLEDNITMKPFNNDDIADDPRALPESVDLGHNIITMLQYNRQQIEVEFCQNDQDCGVCFDTLPGTHFYRIGKCGHHYCRDCMMEYCQLHVSDGTVESLKCPDSECNEIIPPYIVQSVLPPMAYDRWEHLVLQKSLTYMEDIVWCPRCSEPVIKEVEDSLNLAHCVTCFYSFCTECNEMWHQGKRCETAEDKLKNLEQRPVKIDNEVERRRFEEMRQKIRDEIESARLLKIKIRNCPKCKAKIEKVAGCNKMACRCGQSFCWVCGKKLESTVSGYSHFSDNKCFLFTTGDTNIVHRVVRPVAEGNLWVQAHLEINPDLRRRVLPCPCCKQKNLKSGTNNHMKCWNCKTNFCFQCKSRLNGVITQHFTSLTPCHQHS